MSDPVLTAHAIDVLDWAGKAAVALGSVKLFLVGVYKPFAEWRKEHIAKTTREVLAPELTQLQQIINDETGCAENMQTMLRSMRVIFDDLDKFLVIASDNRERIDETNELLDGVFRLDRRVNLERRAEIDAMLINLRERQTVRRRGLDGEPAT